MKKKKSTDIKTLLWATDFSKESRACLPYMKIFNAKLKTKNHALYVLPKFSDWVYETAFLKDDELFETIANTKRKSLKKIENYSKRTELPMDAQILEGIASDELIGFSEENKVDIIFAGRRGISEIEQILIGSTTSRLIRNVKVPVCVIPKSKRDVNIEKILCPIDFSDTDQRELKYAIPLAKQLGAQLYLVHVSEFFNYRVPVLKRDILIEKINNKIAAIAEQYDYEITEIFYDMGEPAQKIIEIAKKKKMDLITMTSHQRSGIEKLFLGSITEKVLMYGNIPVLILPPVDYE